MGGGQLDRSGRARADLRALAAALEERAIPPIPVGRLRWSLRRSGRKRDRDDRPLRFRQVHHRAWLARSDDTALTLALTSAGRLWVTGLLESGSQPSPGRPGCELEGHGPGVRFLSWPGDDVRLDERPDGAVLVVADDVGWGYRFTDEIPLDRLIAQTLDAYTRSPRWHLDSWR